MTRERLSEVDIQQLELDLANLRLEVADKEQQLAEAKLERATDRAQTHSQSATNRNNPPPATTSSSTPPRASRTTRVASSSHVSDASCHRVYTGFKDSNRVKLYIGDIALLKKDSTGKYAPYFHKDDRVKITGVTADHLLFVQSLEYPLQTTT